MAGDKVTINTLERALSSDINDLQSMQARVLADWLLELSAVRTIMNSGGLVDTLPQSVTMGLEVRGAGANLLVATGVLGQASLTWPAAPAALESFFRVGVLRAATYVPVPATPNVFMLLEARVVDVVTVSGLRDVFDAPTQTFVPTALPKQSERRIEFQIVTGTGAKLPVFSGDPWVPILGFNTDGAGEVPALPSTFTWDMRPDLKDQFGEDPVRYGYTGTHPEASLSQQALHTANPNLAVSMFVGGDVRGMSGRHKGWLRARTVGVVPQPDNSASAVAFTLQHLYLAFLGANGIEVMPVLQSDSYLETTKGILVRSGIPPNAGSRDNSAPLVWPAGSPYEDFGDVPAGRAIHIGSAYIESAAGFQWFSQDSAGRCAHQCQTSPVTPLASIASRAIAALAAPDTLAIDLRGIIPPNARTAILEVFVGAYAGAGASLVTASLQPRLGVAARDTWPPVGLAIEGDDAAQVIYDRMTAEVPVQWLGSTTDEGKRWELVLTPVGGAPLVEAVVHCSGWSF